MNGNATISRTLYLEQPDAKHQTLVSERREHPDALPLRVCVTFTRMTDRGDVTERYVFARASDTTVAFSHLQVDYPGEHYTHPDSTLDGRVLEALAKADLALDVRATARDGLLITGGAPAYRDLHDEALAASR